MIETHVNYHKQNNIHLFNKNKYIFKISQNRRDFDRIKYNDYETSDSPDQCTNSEYLMTSNIIFIK